MKSIIALMSMLYVLNLGATTYYIDPASGSMSNDGTAGNPWSTWADVISEGISFSPGDTIILKTGYHGDIILKGDNSGEIVIMAAVGEEPAVNGIKIRNASYWNIDGLIVSPEKAPVFQGGTKVYAIEVTSSHHITIENCFIYTVLDSDSWSKTDWTSLAIRGMMIDCPDVTLRNNYIKNVDMGIIVQHSGRKCFIDRNKIESFSEDGLRMLADSCTIQYNEITDSRNVDQQHNDLVQSWPIDGRGPTGLKFIGNYFHSFPVPGRPYSSTAMGIGIFNKGPYEGAEIYNNVIVNGSWNGIMISSPVDCKVINNTIVGIEGTDRQPYIHFSGDGERGSMDGNVARNNLVSRVKVDPGVSVTVDHNLTQFVVSILRQYFVNADTGNFKLIPGYSYGGNAAIDAGSEEGAPDIDIDGVERPQGQAVDIGAYECTETSTMIYNEFATPGPNRYMTIENPLIESSRITLMLESTARVNLALYDINGKLMSQVIDQRIQAGSEFTTTIDRSGLNTGAYIYNLLVDDQLKANGIVIVK